MPVLKHFYYKYKKKAATTTEFETYNKMIDNKSKRNAPMNYSEKWKKEIRKKNIRQSRNKFPTSNQILNITIFKNVRYYSKF